MSRPPSTHTSRGPRTARSERSFLTISRSRESASPKSRCRGPSSVNDRNAGALTGTIDQEPWFHGFCTHSYTDERLLRPGDWLVRATEARHKTELLISLRAVDRRVVNFSIAYDRNLDRWYLGILREKRPNYVNMVELIRHYQKHRLPGVRTALKHPILRPKWNVEHENLRYDKQKVDGRRESNHRDQLQGFLGAGNFATVYRGTLIQAEKKVEVEVAVKVCHENPEDLAASKAKKKMFQEGFIMSSYKHDNVIQFYGMVLNRPPVVIVLEFCPGGSLLSHLQKQAEAISRGELVMYSFEASKGMNYLHRNQCIHRDLAARNCLVGADGRVKIADFGLSLAGHNLQFDDSEARDRHIPLRWMAPETLTRTPKFSKKSDVWSFGVLLFEIFALGQKPWPDEENKRVATWIRKGKMPEMPTATPPEVRELVNKMWQLNVEERPSFKEILPELFRLHTSTYPPPQPSKCTISGLDGVKREPFDTKLEADRNVEALDLMSQPQTTNDDRSRDDAPQMIAAKRSPFGRSINDSTIVKRR